MKQETELTPGARAYVGAVLVIGAAVAAYLLSRSDPARWDWRPIAVFTLLGLLSTAVSVTYQGFRASVTVHQIGTSFAYALFLLVDPAAVGLSLALVSVADWLVNRRRLLPGLFNIAQLWISVGAACAVRQAVHPGFVEFGATDTHGLVAGAASLLAFFLVNHLLTHLIVSLANRSRLLRLDPGARLGVLNEFLCVVSGLGTAVFWSMYPPLSVLGIIPVWILVALVLALSRREQALEEGQAELHALQEIGLEIGSELDVDRLRASVVRISADALQGSGAVLAGVEAERRRLALLSSRGFEPEPPSELAMSESTAAVMAAGHVQCIEDYVPAPDLFPEFAVLGASGFLCAPLRVRGMSQALLVVTRDGTRRRFDENDVRRTETLVRFVEMALSNAELLSEFRQMQGQLAHTEKMSALGMLVSGVAHEVNNPLTSVLGYTQLVLQRENDPKNRRMLERVASEAGRAGKIVQNLLTFSRKQKSERRLVDLNRVLDVVLDLQAYEMHVSNVEVVRRMCHDLPRVMADPDQLQQVFLNLVTNARHALGDSGRKGRIVVESRCENGKIIVAVADNGIGIAKENLERIFLPFFTTKELGRGTGLGLSICYGIIQEHGGKIAVASRQGEGANFTIELPAAPGEAASAESAEESPQAIGVRPAAGRLIADLVRDTLAPQGWTIETASDGREALVILERRQFDVLLVDLRMPGIDGRTLYTELRRSRPEIARRIIFATGDTGSDSTSEFLGETGCPVLRKPYDLNDLVTTVSRVASEQAAVTARS